MVESITEVGALKVKPGISAYATSPEEAGESFKPLVKFAQQQIPQACWSKTPIYVMATAGMRLLPTVSQTLILSSIRKILERGPFGEHSVRVIDGDEEAHFDWLSLNGGLGYECVSRGCCSLSFSRMCVCVCVCVCVCMCVFGVVRYLSDPDFTAGVVDMGGALYAVLYLYICVWVWVCAKISL